MFNIRLMSRRAACGQPLEHQIVLVGMQPPPGGVV